MSSSSSFCTTYVAVKYVSCVSKHYVTFVV
jgi:hypothetical protein